MSADHHPPHTPDTLERLSRARETQTAAERRPGRRARPPPRRRARGERARLFSLSLSAMCVSVCVNPGTLPGRACVTPNRLRPAGARAVPHEAHTHPHNTRSIIHLYSRAGGERQRESALAPGGEVAGSETGAQWPPVLRSPSALLRDACAQRRNACVEQGTGGAASGRGAILESSAAHCMSESSCNHMNRPATIR